MKIEGVLQRLKTWQAGSIAAVVLAIGIFIYLPHRSKVTESHAVLQNGKKMDVKFTLQSAWGWADPDRLSKMEVTIDGRSVPIKPGSAGSIPVKASQPPIIVEKAGFPEVIALGKDGSSVKQANWSFMNYDLSDRELITTQGKDVSYFAPSGAPPPTTVAVAPLEYVPSQLTPEPAQRIPGTTK